MKKDDMKNKLDFVAVVSLGRGIKDLKVEFSVNLENKKDELDGLTWDEVYDSAVETAENTYTVDDFPKMEITDIFIKKDGGEFRVLAEDHSEEDLKGCPGGKILILPYARYSLTPEFEKYMKLSEAGLVNFEYSVEKMRELMETMK